MATNIAALRAKKAIRRKAVLAERRKAEALESTLLARARRAGHAPIRACLLTESLFESGMGTLILARGFSSDHVTMATFLLDAFCLGIKDVALRSLDAEEFEAYVALTDITGELVEVESSYARKLLHELAAWARSIGFSPYKDFEAAEQMFGDVSAEASDATFQFGYNGKPHYIPGPLEQPFEIRRRLEQLRQSIGEGGFDYSDTEISARPVGPQMLGWAGNDETVGEAGTR